MYINWAAAFPAFLSNGLDNVVENNALQSCDKMFTSLF